MCDSIQNSRESIENMLQKYGVSHEDVQKTWEGMYKKNMKIKSMIDHGHTWADLDSWSLDTLMWQCAKEKQGRIEV